MCNNDIRLENCHIYKQDYIHNIIGKHNVTCSAIIYMYIIDNDGIFL